MLLYPWVLGTLVFIIGTIIGSFLNLLIYRMGSGAGLSGRSRCLSCGKTLTVRMLIPLVSYILQRGRCAYCGAKLSIQYPLVEAATGALLLLAWQTHGIDPFASDILQITLFFLDAAIWSTLLTVIVYDLKHKIIPDRLSFLFALCAGAALFLKWQWGLLAPVFLPFLGVFIPVWLDALAGPLLALPFALLWFLSGGRAMGLGDAKLAWGLGWFLGFSGGISAVVLAFWLAFFPSIFLLFLRRKRFTMKSEVPFAPFLILGTTIVYALGVDILRWTL